MLEAPLVDRRDARACATRASTRRAPRARGPTPRRSPPPRSPAARSATDRAACPRGSPAQVRAHRDARHVSRCPPRRRGRAGPAGSPTRRSRPPASTSRTGGRRWCRRPSPASRRSAATAADVQPCSPICETQPIWTSSTAPGSTSCRSTSPFSTCAASSSAADRRERAVPLADRAANGVDDQGVTHRSTAVRDRHAPGRPSARARRGPRTRCRSRRRGPSPCSRRAPRRRRLRPRPARRCGRRSRRPSRRGARTRRCGRRRAARARARRPPCEIARAQRIARAGPSKRREEAVAGGVQLDSAVAGELPPHERVVLCEQLAPAAVAELARRARSSRRCP